MHSSPAPIRSGRSCCCSGPMPASCTSAPKSSSTPRWTIRAIRSRSSALKATRWPLSRRAWSRRRTRCRCSAAGARSGSRPAAGISPPRSKPWWQARRSTAASSSKPATSSATRRSAPSARRRNPQPCCPAMPTTSAISPGSSTTRCATAKLTIAPDARAALVSLIGGDRQASRSEIRKLALYAHGKDRVVLEDVIAVVADASALALDAVVDAAFAGRASGDRSAVLQGACRPARRPARSCRGRCATSRNCTRRGLTLDAGEDTFTAMRSFIPPIHFSPPTLVQAALSRGPRRGWSGRWSSWPKPRSTCGAQPRLPVALAQRALLSLACRPAARSGDLWADCFSARRV